MAVRVVDIFEVVEVDKNQRKFVVVALRPVDLRFQHEIQVPRVVKSGAVIRDGQLVNALHVARILHGDGREIRQHFKQRQVALTESVRAHAIDQLDDSQRAVSKTHRHRHDRPRLHLRFFIYLGKEARILAGVGNDHYFTGLRHPSGNSLPQLDADIFERRAGLTRSNLEIQFLLGFVHQQQRPGIGVQKLFDLLHDGAEDLVQLERRSEGLAKLVENRHLAQPARIGLHVSDDGIAPAFYPGKIFVFLHHSAESKKLDISIAVAVRVPTGGGEPVSFPHGL